MNSERNATMTSSAPTLSAPATSADRAAAPDAWTRLAPLSGVAFFGCLIAAAITSGSPPDDFSSGATVISFYQAHQGAQKISNLLAALSVVFVMCFASYLRGYLRRRGVDALASAVFGGLTILAVGGAARAGIGWELATGHAKLDPSAAQTLYALYSTHYPAVVGIAVFMFAVFIAVLRTSALPAWLGWLALPIGFIAIAPPTLIPLIGSGVWILVTSIVLYARGGRAVSSAA